VAKARALLDGPRQSGKPILVVVACNSGGQRTGWHRDRWVQTIRAAHSDLNYIPVYVGTKDDREQVEALREQAGAGFSIAGETGIGDLAAVLALSDMAISLDTGTMHVGRAVDLPMVVLGPSWQKPHEWLPLGKPNVRILRGEDRIGVPEGYRLDEISAESAMDALSELSQLYPPDPEACERRLSASLSDVDLLAR
jgi:ADP-heptose:LPS heptosyltransferase